MATDKPIRVVHEIDDYVKLVASTPCIVKFTADWCGPCKRMAPTYEKLAETYGQKIQFLEVDIDKSPMLATNVQAIPLFLFYLNGDIIPDLTVRGGSVQMLTQNMTKFVGDLEKLVVVAKPPPMILERLTADDVEASGSDFEDYVEEEPDEPESPDDSPEETNTEPIIEKTIPDDLIHANEQESAEPAEPAK